MSHDLLVQLAYFFDFSFSLRYLQDHGLLKSGDFATMAT